MDLDPYPGPSGELVITSAISGSGSLVSATNVTIAQIDMSQFQPDPEYQYAASDDVHHTIHRDGRETWVWTGLLDVAFFSEYMPSGGSLAVRKIDPYVLQHVDKQTIITQTQITSGIGRAGAIELTLVHHKGR